MVSALTVAMNRRSAYPTDVTDRQWELLAPLLPAPAATGDPREHELREVVNALLYMAHTGCQWRFVPHDFPPWSVVRYYFDHWTVDGTLSGSTPPCTNTSAGPLAATPNPARAL